MPREEIKNGEKIVIATAEELRSLENPIILDLRDPNEVEDNAGGKALPGSLNVPLNVDGVKQSIHLTTREEFQAKLEAAGALPEDKSRPIITHCKGGGRGHKGAVILEEMGYVSVHNGASAHDIAAAILPPQVPSPVEEPSALQVMAERAKHVAQGLMGN